MQANLTQLLGGGENQQTGCLGNRRKQFNNPTPDIEFSLGETKSRLIGASFVPHEFSMTIM